MNEADDADVEVDVDVEIDVDVEVEVVVGDDVDVVVDNIVGRVDEVVKAVGVGVVRVAFCIDVIGTPPDIDDDGAEVADSVEVKSD